MKKIVNYVCKKCNYVDIEQRTAKKVVKKVFKSIFTILIIITSLIGATGIYNFVIGIGYNNNPNLMFSIGGAYAFVTNFRQTFQSNNEIHDIALNLTSQCSDDYCRAKAVYDTLLTFDYEQGTDLNPLDIWHDKKGDCDEISNLNVALLKSLHIKSEMQCSDFHCWSLTNLGDKKVLEDIVNGIWEEK